MKQLRYFATVLILMALHTSAQAAGAGPALQTANTDVSNRAALQEGAKLFVNYCMGCHSANYLRFQRVGQDLGMTDDEVAQYLMYTTEKIGEGMTIAMDRNDSKRWFGVTPPDLSVIARARGVDWLYTYMLSFYTDPARPWGVNNLVFKDVGMPHALWELQGEQQLVHKSVTDDKGNIHEVAELELVGKDQMSPADHQQKVAKYEQAVLNLVTFLEYMGEPAKLERQRLGPWVLLFLFIFLIVAYLLKKEYWRDVH